MSNLPPGTHELDADAPWNQPDAEPKSWIVEMKVRVTAVDDDAAKEEAEELLKKAGVPWRDYDIEEAVEEA